MLRSDVLAGLTTTVISLPVALGFGIASGLGAAAGLWCAIAVGFFASVFGGTNSQISGPTAPMTVAMTVVVSTHADSLAEALTIVVMAGTIQMLMGVSKIGRFVAYTPQVVISGFMSGIGIIVMLLQLLPMLGAASSTGGPVGVVQALPSAAADIQTGAAIIAAATLIVGFLWPKKLARIAPGPLVALGAGTALGILLFNDAPVIGTVPIGLPSFHFPLLAPGFWVQAAEPAIILALLGSVDSLITSLIADSMTGSRHNPTKELIGQGIGNIAAGLIGALPGAGATLGTVVNIRSGGLTPVSGVTRSAILLALVLGLGHLVEPIPLAALGAVLFKVGWDIMDKRTLARLHRLRREHLFVMLLVLFLTVFVDLMTAVAIGLIAGAMAQARRLDQLEVDNVISVPLLDSVFFAEVGEPPGGDMFSARVGMVALRGSLTVASSHKLVTVFGLDIKEHEVVIFDFSDTVFIDDSAAMVIGRLLEVAEQSDTECIVMGMGSEVAKTLNSFGILQPVQAERIVETREEACRISKSLLESKYGSNG